MRRGALALALIGGPAAALSPAPNCELDTEGQRFHAFGEGPQTAPLADVFPQQVGYEFAVTQAVSRGASILVLHHCPTDQYLYTVAPGAREDAVLSRFDEMMVSPEPYTMRQIAEELAPLGAQSRIGAGDIGRCDCWSVGLD